MAKEKSKPKEVISFRLSDETLNQLNDLAQRLETNKTKVLELLIEDYWNETTPKQSDSKKSNGKYCMQSLKIW